MPLPDYEFYTASYLGEKIPQESFARFITRAARQLERYKSMFDVRRARACGNRKPAPSAPWRMQCMPLRRRTSAAAW